MSKSLNLVQLIGNLTKEPEIRTTPNGTMVANISIATNYSWRERETNVQRDEVEYHNIVLWGPQAEIVQKYVKKGEKIYIQGRLRTRSWEAQDGSKRQITEVIAESLLLLGAPKAPQTGSTTNTTNDTKQKKTKDNSDKELPTISLDDEPNSISAEDLPF